MHYARSGLVAGHEPKFRGQYNRTKFCDSLDILMAHSEMIYGVIAELFLMCTGSLKWYFVENEEKIGKMRKFFGTTFFKEKVNGFGFFR